MTDIQISWKLVSRGVKAILRAKQGFALNMHLLQEGVITKEHHKTWIMNIYMNTGELEKHTDGFVSWKVSNSITFER